MKKFNKASLVIAPMALMLFSSSLNIPKVMADDNGSWSEQEQINQQNKHNQELVDKYKNYTTKELYEFLSDVEQQIPNIIDIANKDYENDYKRMYNNDEYNNLIKQIENINENSESFTENDLNGFNQFDNSLNRNKDFDQKLKETFNMIENKQGNIKQNIMELKKESLDFLYKIVNGNNDRINNLNNITKNESKKYLEYKSSALEKSNYLKNKISNNKDIISIKNIQDLQNVISDLHFVRDNITSYQYVKYNKNIDSNLDELSSYLNLLYRQSEKGSSKSSISLDDEVDNLKNQINSINNKSNNSYIPVSNNSNVNNNNDALKNELNNAKNNINNIINKNVELSNTTSSLKNEIETLKQQVHELKNNKKSKHKNTKANKRALNKKKKELNKVNKELKKHIRKSNKKKLIQKRNSILKSIKKLNK